MSNKNIFKGKQWTKLATMATNEAGGKAYAMEAKHALAQYAVTGCFNNTYYTNSQTQLESVKALVDKVDPEFVAKVAVYSRKYGFMKDMPAFLLAYLCANDAQLFSKSFFQVCDNIKMIRNFAQIIRSGSVGRKSFGTLPKKLINKWFDSKNDDVLFRSSIGNDPSIADLIKMVHPKPLNDYRNALYGYFLGKDYNQEFLPAIVKQFESFKKDNSKEIPNVPFEMLTALPLTKQHWVEIARNSTWTQTRMNLNTFSRHGVFEDEQNVKIVADKLVDAEEIAKSKVFPYQLMAAYLNVNENIPKKITNALQDAMEISIENIPKIDGKIFVFPDVSGSMRSPITGYREGATSKVECVHVAALIAASLLRKNQDTEVIPFAESARVGLKLNPKDSIMTNANKIFTQPGGGTNCSAPLLYLNMQKKNADLLVYVSDNESWIDTRQHSSYGYMYGYKSSASETMHQWIEFVKRNQNAKMICIDITPNETMQAPNDRKILNVGGFNDNVFNVMHDFIQNFDGNDEFWTKIIEEKISL